MELMVSQCHFYVSLLCNVNSFEIVFVKSNNSFYLPMTRKMYQLPLCLHSSNYVLKLHLIVAFSHHEEPYDLIYQGGYSGIGPENGQLNCNRIVIIVD